MGIGNVITVISEGVLLMQMLLWYASPGEGSTHTTVQIPRQAHSWLIIIYTPVPVYLINTWIKL